jgi:HEAT repeat protein
LDAAPYHDVIATKIPAIIGLLCDVYSDVRRTALTALATLSEQREHCQLFETAADH